MGESNFDMYSCVSAGFPPGLLKFFPPGGGEFVPPGGGEFLPPGGAEFLPPGGAEFLPPGRQPGGKRSKRSTPAFPPAFLGHQGETEQIHPRGK